MVYHKIIKKLSSKTSLNLLKEKALKADFKTPRLSVQKLISKKDVSPINSQPKNKVKPFSAKTKIIILKINQFI